MSNLIKCPSCHHEFALDQILAHELEEKARQKLEERYQKELQAAIDQAKSQTTSELELKLKSLADQAAEEKEKSKKLMTELLDQGKLLRAAQADKEASELELQKKLIDAEAKIKAETRKKSDEEHALKTQEKDKVIADLQKALADAQRKAEQGSQQTQGEVLELEIEHILRSTFPLDQISEVKKGVRGADVVQTVVDRLGRTCGTILWESKNAQWSGTWITKLKEDGREAHADLKVLVATNPPDNIKTFGYLDGVWVTTRAFVAPLATALRYSLVALKDEKAKSEGRGQKQEVLYNYVTSTEFRFRIEAIMENYSAMQEEIEREKRWFQTKWARQEKQLRTLVDNTGGVYGELQAVVGKSLPTLESGAPTQSSLIEE